MPHQLCTLSGCVAERHGFGPSYLDRHPQRIAAVSTAEVKATLK